MEKITFVNNQTAASAETFNQMQDNIEAAITEVKNDSYQIKDYITIPDDTDLNTLAEYGTYRSTSSSKTATMSNVPNGVAGGFTLYVMGYTSIAANAQYRRQEIINGVNTYIRTTSNAGSTWNTWQKIVLEDA